MSEWVIKIKVRANKSIHYEETIPNYYTHYRIIS